MIVRGVGDVRREGRRRRAVGLAGHRVELAVTRCAGIVEVGMEGEALEPTFAVVLKHRNVGGQVQGLDDRRPVRADVVQVAALVVDEEATIR